MKKTITFILTITLLFCFTACSSQASNSTEPTPNTPAESSTAIEKNIDAVAEYLGYSDGEETMYSMIGATAGKEYNSGAFELYQFDENSEAYSTIINGGGMVQAAAFKDGIVLVFPNGESGDKAIIDSFNSVEFK